MKLEIGCLFRQKYVENRILLGPPADLSVDDGKRLAAYVKDGPINYNCFPKTMDRFHKREEFVPNSSWFINVKT